MTIKVKVEGVAPLIMHKFFVEPEGEKKSARGKKVYVPADEAEKVTYRNDKKELCIPGTHFKAAMIKSATDFPFKGKKSYKDFIKAGIFIEEDLIKLDQQEYEIYNCPVVVQRSRIMRSRPMIRKWSCTFNIENIDPDTLSADAIKQILEAAGKYKGVCDNRPEFGRFKVTQFK